MYLHALFSLINNDSILFCFLVLCTIKPCHTFATCKDIPNAFTCTCKQGYTGNGISTSGCTGKILCIYDSQVSYYSTVILTETVIQQ